MSEKIIKEEDYAKACPKCGGYYPGDCLHGGCMDRNCNCDGCQTYRAMSQDEEWDWSQDNFEEEF